jgi:hypothetical protein
MYFSKFCKIEVVPLKELDIKGTLHTIAKNKSFLNFWALLAHKVRILSYFFVLCVLITLDRSEILTWGFHQKLSKKYFKMWKNKNLEKLNKKIMN